MNQSNSPFGNLSREGLEEQKDTLGGSKFGVVESGVYNGVIKSAYAGKSDGGAHNMTFNIELDVDGRPHEYREVVYITNKKGENFYVTKDDKKSKVPLPGFVVANDIAAMSTGTELSEQAFDERVVKIYNFDAKAEVATKVQMAIDLIGKPITLAIVKKIDDKKKKNDATGEYEPTGETQEVNNIDKVFHTESRRTFSEVVKKGEAEFIDAWAKKNTGQTRNVAKGAEGKTGAPGAATNVGGAAGKPSKSLFG